MSKDAMPYFVADVEIRERESKKDNFFPLSPEYSEEPKIKVISYSEVFKWDTCQRQYFYRFVRGLQPLEESDAITTGTKGHKLLQTFYTLLSENKSKDEAIKLTNDSAKKLMEHDKLNFDLLNAWNLVNNYMSSYDINAAPHLIENRFLFPASILSDDPLLGDVHIGFTPDVVFKRNSGWFDVEDSKFVQRAWPKSKLDHFQQAKLYQIFLQAMGYKVSQSRIRFFNVKTGAVTTKSDNLSVAESQIITEDFLQAIKEVIRYREIPTPFARRTTNYTACNFCAFSHPCNLERQGKSAEKTFQYQFKKSDYDYTR